MALSISFKKLLESLLVLEVGFFVQAAFDQQVDERRFTETAAELGGRGFVLLNIEQEGGEASAFQAYAFLGLHDVVLGGALHQFAGKFAVVADVAFGFAAFHAIERRLRDVDMAAIDELLHVAEEESEQQGTDVRAVDVGVGHQNNFVIAQLAGIEIVLTDARAECGDDGADFFVAEHFVVAGFFDVEDFALERKDRLELAIAAHFRGAAGRFTLDDKQFAAAGIAFLTVRELAGQTAGIHGGFAASQFAGFTGGFAGARGVNALADDATSDGGMLVEPFAEFFVDQLLDVALDVAVELALGLALELGLRQTDADDRYKTFTNVVTGDADFILLFLEHSGIGGEIVDGAGERGAKAGEVRAAVHGVDGVGEGEHVLAVAVVVLQGNFDFHVALLAFHVDRGIVERFFAAVEVLDELGDTAGEAELRGFFGALVGERNLEALVQEGVFAKARGQGVVAEDCFLKDGSVGVKRHFGARLARFPGLLELGGGFALFIGLFPHGAIALDFQFEFIGKSVDHGYADAVKTAGNFVGFAVEFSAGVQHGKNDFSGGAFFGGVHVHGNAAPIVHNGDGIIGVHRDVDFVGVAGHGFVDGIVDDFPHQVVQAHFAGGADVHRRP